LEEKGVTVRLATRVLAIDRERRRIACSDGVARTYDKLVLATGSRPRTLALAPTEATRILYLRTFDDALRLRAHFCLGARIALIGGGYIGLEIAASARLAGCDVTVIETANALMTRVAGPRVSAFLRSLHEANGVDVRLGRQVREISEKGESVEIVLKSGEMLQADVAVVGIGAEPRVELAAQAGLAVANGVVVDGHGRTSDPHIFSCGDVAEHPNPILGRRVRLESWQNAQQQGSVVGAALASGTGSRQYAMVPWFWSDQYDANLQMIGAPERWDEEILRGHPAEKSFTVIYLDHGRIVGAAAVNRPRDVAPIRSAIERALSPSHALLADSSTNLVEVIKAASRRTQNVA
jgi:3-phenylpropionate/trans-cinnamate dioxygenase ferredoxin reductase subunit